MDVRFWFEAAVELGLYAMILTTLLYLLSMAIGNPKVAKKIKSD